MITPIKISMQNLGSLVSEEFEFIKGEPVSVKGRNERHPSLKTNGVGKSLIKDAVTIALADDVVRDDGVTIKDMIRRGTDSMSVQLTLRSDSKRSSITISRTYFSGKNKPQKVEIWEVDEFMEDRRDVSCASVSEYNKWIMEWIGITKDELFSFYIISKNFKSFHSMSDDDKKSVIMKVSRSESVNSAIENIKLEMKLKEKRLSEIGVQMSTLESQIKMLNEQIQDSDPEKAKEAVLNRYAEIIKNSEDSIAALDEKMLSLEGGVKKDKKELEFMSSVIDKTKDELDKYRSTSADILKQFEEDIKQVNKNIDDTDALISELKESIKQMDGIKAEVNREISKLNARKDVLESIVGQSVSCPECKHKFVPDFDMTIGQMEEEIKGIVLEIADKNTVIKDCDDGIEEMNKSIDESSEIREEFKKDLIRTKEDMSEYVSHEQSLTKAHKSAVDDHDIAKRLLDSKNSLIGTYSRDIETLSKTIVSTEEEIEKVKSEDSKSDPTAVLKKSIKSTESELDKLDIEAADVMKDASELEQWSDLFSQFKIHITNKTIDIVQDMINQILIKLSNPYRIAMKGFTVLASGETRGKISTDVVADGNPCKFGTFSEGEKARMDICTVLVFQDCINRSCEGGGLDLLIIDEKMDSISSKSIGEVIDVIRTNNRTSMVITQLDEDSHTANEVTIVKLKDNTAVIEKTK